jgi:hypothetical protein
LVRLEDKGGASGSGRRSHQDRSDEEAKARASQYHPCSLTLRPFKKANLINQAAARGKISALKNVVFWGISAWSDATLHRYFPKEAEQRISNDLAMLLIPPRRTIATKVSYPRGTF